MLKVRFVIVSPIYFYEISLRWTDVYICSMSADITYTCMRNLSSMDVRLSSTVGPIMIMSFIDVLAEASNIT